MRLLILGGTAFLGRAVATSALSAGHDVTCASRRRSERSRRPPGRVAPGRQAPGLTAEDEAALLAEWHRPAG